MSDVGGANIFLRLSTRDDPQESARSPDLLRRAERGAEHPVTSEAVGAEVVPVLSAREISGRPRSAIAIRLGARPVNRGPRPDHQVAVLAALAVQGRTNLHFVVEHPEP